MTCSLAVCAVRRVGACGPLRHSVWPSNLDKGKACVELEGGVGRLGELELARVPRVSHEPLRDAVRDIYISCFIPQSVRDL